MSGWNQPLAITATPYSMKHLTVEKKNLISIFKTITATLPKDNSWFSSNLFCLLFFLSTSLLPLNILFLTVIHRCCACQRCNEKLVVLFVAYCQDMDGKLSNQDFAETTSLSHFWPAELLPRFLARCWRTSVINVGLSLFLVGFLFHFAYIRVISTMV